MVENYLAKLRKALLEKYGDDFLDTPEEDKNFHKSFQKQEQALYEKRCESISEDNYENRNGYLVNKRLIRNDISNCEYCNKYKLHFNIKDDTCIAKYGCCYHCYMDHIEAREERWLKGWRPERNNE